MAAVPPFLDSLEGVALLGRFWGGAVGKPPNEVLLHWHPGSLEKFLFRSVWRPR